MKTAQEEAIDVWLWAVLCRALPGDLVLKWLYSSSTAYQKLLAYVVRVDARARREAWAEGCAYAIEAGNKATGLDNPHPQVFIPNDEL